MDDSASSPDPQTMDPVKRRPFSVTIISWLFIAAGVVGLAYHLSELNPQHDLGHEVVWMLILRLLAILSGVLMLRGSNWGRWLLLGWMMYHVILSAFHPVVELTVHALLLVALAYFLLRKDAATYFRRSKPSLA